MRTTLSTKPDVIYFYKTILLQTFSGVIRLKIAETFRTFPGYQIFHENSQKQKNPLL
jgi:hypothetical protein